MPDNLSVPTPEQLAAQVRTAHLEIDRFFTKGNWTSLAVYFDGTLDAVLLASPYNWSQALIDRVKAVYNQMEALRATYEEPNGLQFLVRQDVGTGL